MHGKPILPSSERRKQYSQHHFHPLIKKNRPSRRTIINPNNYNYNNMSKDNIQDAVSKNLEKYFRDLGEQQASNIYDMVVLAVEKPMLEMVMSRAESNQSQAADMLGINRNTLRKKLQQHGLI